MYIEFFNLDQIHTMKYKEITALAEWKTALRNGMFLIEDNQHQDAIDFFLMALSIGLLRHQVTTNKYFNEFHIERPLRHLIQYF
ncbi:MAG: hypothetical protein AAGB12_15225, partial [Pseudomonadota bacterium]